MTKSSIDRFKAELEFLKVQQRIRDAERELERLNELRDQLMKNFIDKRVYELEQKIQVEEIPKFQTAEELREMSIPTPLKTKKIRGKKKK